MARPLGKRTAKLLREAIVLAHVEGARWAGYHGGSDGYPKDSDVVRKVLCSAVSFADLYPTLSKLDVAQQVDDERRERQAQGLAEFLRTEGIGEVQ
jgi:hypothetical protein